MQPAVAPSLSVPPTRFLSFTTRPGVPLICCRHRESWTDSPSPWARSGRCKCLGNIFGEGNFPPPSKVMHLFLSQNRRRRKKSRNGRIIKTCPSVPFHVATVLSRKWNGKGAAREIGPSKPVPPTHPPLKQLFMHKNAHPSLPRSPVSCSDSSSSFPAFLPLRSPWERKRVFASWSEFHRPCDQNSEFFRLFKVGTELLGDC